MRLAMSRHQALAINSILPQSWRARRKWEHEGDANQASRLTSAPSADTLANIRGANPYEKREVVMKGRVLAALAVALLTTGVALAQAPGDYLDVEMVRVKPEKQMEFDALNKKMAEA